MRSSTHKRSRTARRTVAVTAALALGAGGLITANVLASASESDSPGGGGQDRAAAGTAATIDCPDVTGQLSSVPEQARAQVDRELANLDQQVSRAYQRLSDSQRAIRQDPNFAQNAIIGPLQDKRKATIDRIAIAIGRVADKPQGLDALAACELRDSGNSDGEADPGQGGDGAQDGDQGGDGDQQGNGGQAGNGPVAADFVDITQVEPNVSEPQQSQNASQGVFTTECGVNANKLYNTDNIIVAPGVENGAHHTHDYVGNQDTDAFSSNEELDNADTSCANPGDKSSYYWPVLRLQDGTDEFDADQLGGGAEGNVGRILTAKQATLNFVGNPLGDVVAMPKFLRIITGDAKAFTNDPVNANASWSCTGFEDQVQLADKYPLCPEGSDVVRTSKFQSCWDGANIDSANHRDHVAFADESGRCPEGFQAIPQLVQRLIYDVDAPSVEDNGQTSPFFAVDGFPEQLHKPITDHGDFVNVFDEDLMDRMVECINSGRRCS